MVNRCLHHTHAGEVTHVFVDDVGTGKTFYVRSVNPHDTSTSSADDFTSNSTSYSIPTQEFALVFLAVTSQSYPHAIMVPLLAVANITGMRLLRA